eukprot:10018-Heterococcus_DN1.PRE.1
MRANMKAATIATVLLLAGSASADKVTANAKDLQEDTGKVAADAKGVLEGLAERAGNILHHGQHKAGEAADATTRAAGEAAGYVAGTGAAAKDAAGNTINAGATKAGQAADATTRAAGEAAGYVAGTGAAAKDAAGNTINAGVRKAQEGADYVVDSGVAAKDS